MATTSLGTIPEDFPINGVYEAPVIADLPSLVYAMRPNFRELVWDADGGFADDWQDRSSLDGNSTDGYVFRLGRRAFSAASLAIFAAGTGSGGGAVTLGGNVEGESDANVVVAIQDIPVVIDGGPNVGDVLTYREPGGDPRLVFEPPEEAGDATSIQGEPVPTPTNGVLTFDGTDLSWAVLAGSGDVVGPASAIADRVATFNGTTGKLVKDGGKTIAGIEASVVAVAAAYTDAAVAVHDYYRGYWATTSVSFSSYTWANLLALYSATGQYVDDAFSGITRVSDTLVISKTGLYFLDMKIGSYGATGGYLGFRAQLQSATVVQASVYFNPVTDKEAPSHLSGVFRATAGDVLTLQFCSNGGSGFASYGGGSLYPVDGQNLRGFNLSVVQLGP